jgi:hypothetical protein
MNKPFFFRIDAADLLNFATDPDGESMTVLQLAKELQRGSSEIKYIQQVIDEAKGFKEKKRNSGRLGGLAKSSGAKAMLEQNVANPSTPLASSSNRSSNSIEPKHMSDKSNHYADDFLDFWATYPKKTGKGEAFKKWKKEKPKLDDVVHALAWQKESKNWLDGYIPMPATYLNQRRWEDEPTTEKQAPFQQSIHGSM